MGIFKEALQAEILHLRNGRLLPRHIARSAIEDSVSIVRNTFEEGVTERRIATHLGELTVSRRVFMNDLGPKPTVHISRALVLDTGSGILRCEENALGMPMIMLDNASLHGPNRLEAARKIQSAVGLAKHALDLAA